MATDFTQDAVLHFLQSSGGSVKNSDLLLHFRSFVRDHADRDRNRELFKKFVNSVATVKQTDGVSYVVLRKKFKGHVPGGGGGAGAGGSSGPPRLPAGKKTEPAPGSANLNPAVRTEKPRHTVQQQKEETPPAPPAETTRKTILPAAGIMLNNNNNNVETHVNLKQQQQQQANRSPGPSARPAQILGQTPGLSEPAVPVQHSTVGQQRPGSGPLHGTTPGPSARPGQVVGQTPGLSEPAVPVQHSTVGQRLGSGPLHGTTPGPSARPAQVLGPTSGLSEPAVPVHHSTVGQQRPGPGPLHGATPGPSSRPAQVVGQTPGLSEPAVPVHHSTVGQQRPGPGPLHGITPGPPAVVHYREPSQQAPVPEPVRGREVQAEGGQRSQGAPRRMRYRPSYKAAVSCDDDEEEEEEEVSIRRGSAGGAWPLNVPLTDNLKVISASSPCIVDPPAPPSVVSSSSSSSSERKPPKIYIQDVEGEKPTPRGPGWSLETGAGLSGPLEPWSVPGDTMAPRRSLPLEAERYSPSQHPSAEAALHHNIQHQHRYSQPAGVQLEPRQASRQSPRPWLSSSQGNIFSPGSDVSFSSNDWSPSGSPRRSCSSSEDLHTRAGDPVGAAKFQEVLQRNQGAKLGNVAHRADNNTTVPWHHSMGNLYDDQEPTARLSPLHRSTDHLNIQDPARRVMPWHLSTGDLYDDHEDGESSDGSMSSPQLRHRPGVARRLSSQLRTRMCRSMGADLDQLLQEEARGSDGGGGGNEAARRSRLHRISSSLSLRYNLSTSSLSSCSTPPRSSSAANLVEGLERSGERRSLPSAAITSSPYRDGRGRQSSVPLEPREHAWLVKGAAGAWPDIYSLFREDMSLLNKRDFISGFTVLHWIAKHGDHRVLNTLWYGVEKAGLTFDIDARSTSGHTPLHIAAIHGHRNIMRLLVNKFKADVKLRDTAGKKPWQYLSRTAPLEMFHLLGAPARAAVTGQGVGRADSSWEQQQQQQQQRRRRRHHFSSASGQRPLTVAGTTKVKRSSSIAAFLKHKSLHRFYGNQPDSPL